MKRKKNINLILSIIGFILINISLYLTIYFYYDYKKNNTLIKEYFNTTTISKDSQIKKTNNSFLGILEIPLINLKQGFYDINNKNNNIKNGIQVLNNSKMPNDSNNILVLASHSGNGIHSYFNKINTLNINDLLFLYYEGNKYIYQINDIVKIPKDGHLTISYTNNSQLILTTCDKDDKTKQLVIKSQLKEINAY